MVTVGIPVQSPAGEVEDPVESISRRGVRVEHEKPGKTRSRYRRVSAQTRGIRHGSAAAQNQVAIARQNPDVVGVLMEWVLPPTLADGANQQKLTHMQCAGCRYRAGADIPTRSWDPSDQAWSGH